MTRQRVYFKHFQINIGKFLHFSTITLSFFTPTKISYTYYILLSV